MKRNIARKIKGTAQRPRLVMYRSLSHIFAQIIDDDLGHTLASASTMEKVFHKKLKSTRDVAAAKAIGEEVARRAIEKGIKKVVFDRGNKRFHGRVKTLADTARAGGLEF